MNKIKIHKCEQNLIKCRGKFFETRKTYDIHTTKNDEEGKKKINEEEKCAALKSKRQKSQETKNNQT